MGQTNVLTKFEFTWLYIEKQKSTIPAYMIFYGLVTASQEN